LQSVPPMPYRSTPPATLVDVLRARADAAPDERAFTFLVDGETEEQSWTHGELDTRARAIAARLSASLAPGRRVLLLYPAGLEFIAAFMGTLYAGLVPVPTYPPDPARLARTLPRLRAVAADAQVGAVLSTRWIVDMARAISADAPDLAALPWLSSDDVPLRDADGFRAPIVRERDLAFLQYTSGSTAEPKGVMVSHRNVLHNSRLIQRVTGTSARSVAVVWLPQIHDMGLVGGILQPLFVGFPAILMSPVDFLRAPIRWLRALTRHRGTYTGAPNFAYDLCVQKTTPAEREGLDLSSWETASNGAEMVREGTMRRFSETFRPYGFRDEAWLPSYGLAEVVLGASWSRRAAPFSLSVRSSALRENVVVPAPDPTDPDRRLVVGCGPTPPGTSVRIVDPATRDALDAGTVGEIWIASESVAEGYWNRPELTEDTFRARLADGSGSYLRTGDLGFQCADELFVTGRRKDLVVLHGVNHYPEDIEQSVEGAHPAIRATCTAAFATEVGGVERLALVAEIDPRAGASHDDVVAAVRAAVLRDHALVPAVVALLPPRTIPKTSSGKIQRSACRSALAVGDLEALAQSESTKPVHGETTDLSRWLDAQVASLTGHPADASRDQLSLDSVGAMDLLTRIETELGVRVPVSELLEGSRSRLLGYIAAHVGAPARPKTALFELQPFAARRPFFCVPGALATGFSLAALSAAVGRDQPFYTFDPPGAAAGEAPLESLADLAARYLDAISEIQPRGPYHLGGHSFGGLVALEMARRLEARGEHVARLCLFDTAVPGPPPDDAALVAELTTVLAHVRGPRATPTDAEVRAYRANATALRGYRPEPTSLPITLFVAEGSMPIADWRTPAVAEPALGWGRLCSDLTVVRVEGDHFSMLKAPHVDGLGRRLREVLGDVAPLEIPLARLRSTAPPPPSSAQRLRESPEPERPFVLEAIFDPSLDPYPLYHQLRATQPVAWSERFGLWLCTRHADVSTCLRDPRLSSDSRHATDVDVPDDARLLLGSLRASERRRDTPVAAVMNNFPMFLDPPRHTRLRRLLVKSFSPRVIERMREQARSLVGGAVREMQARGHGDVMEELALPLPLRMILGILGLPTDDAERVRGWTAAFGEASGLLVPRDTLERGNEAVASFGRYLHDEIARRKGPPGSAVLDQMLRQQVGEDALSMDEVVAGCVMLFIAGFDTMTTMIGSALVALSRFPAERARLRADPGLLPTAIEELLRHSGTAQWALRTALQDMQIGTKTIRRGENVLLGLGAANRDPARFAEPDRLDLRRRPDGHFAFGHGRHSCFGATLARLELEEAIGALVRATPELVVDESRLTWRRGFGGVVGPSLLPVTFPEAVELRAAG
jgi:acyl-CoA synthetase (AMP-forming)/AMP-acid ligase II/cytochrome P450/thioesterase domain-containing protein/acyl carrier protein